MFGGLCYLNLLVHRGWHGRRNTCHLGKPRGAGKGAFLRLLRVNETLHMRREKARIALLKFGALPVVTCDHVAAGGRST